MLQNFSSQNFGLQDVVSQLEQTVVCISRIVTWLQQQDNKIFETFECQQDFRIDEIQKNDLPFLGSLPTKPFGGRFSELSNLPAQIQEIERLANISLDPTPKEHFQQLSKRHTSLEIYFASIRSNLLIVVDESYHQIRLSFGDCPRGKRFDLIKTLLCHQVCTRLKPFSKTEFTFGFGELCDLKEVAWTVAVFYRNLGYQALIKCGSEVVEVDAIFADIEMSHSWQSPSQRAPVQKELSDFVKEMHRSGL
jgi:hypothetical protein